jgi:hypothetical protein
MRIFMKVDGYRFVPEVQIYFAAVALPPLGIRKVLQDFFCGAALI